ncbi:MAG: glycosyltransferase family 39 protein [Burkholderiales bacterium]|nr:glycosyltransferase family 39 protein [Phycisphaerae bacterium]
MKRRPFAWLFVAIISAAGSVYLLGNANVQLWDRDEPRFAQTSRQMLNSGDWVVPRFLDTVRTAKPVLIYWCQATSMSFLNDNAFAARLPSVLAVVLTLALLGIVITREAGSNRGLWTIFIFSSCTLAIGAAKMCLTDSVLLLFITISQLCIYRIWKYGGGIVTVLLLGVSIGLAGLTKGPVAIGVNLTTIAALCLFGWRWPGVDRGPLSGRQFAIITGATLLIVAIVVGPWMYLIEQRVPGFISGSFQNDVVNRIASGQEGHWGPPGYYTLAVWVTFFPWSLLIPAAIVTGWRNRHQPATRFALAALIGPWVMFELFATKLPHYVLPTYPALAYLTADMLLRASRASIRDLRSRAFLGLVWIGALVVILVGSVPWAMLIYAKQFDLLSIVAASLAMVTGIMMGVGAAIRFTCAQPLGAARALGLGMFSLVALVYAMFLPRYEPLRISARVAEIISEQGGHGQFGYMIDYKEPSLAFHQGGGLREQKVDDYLNQSAPAQWPRWIVTTRRVWEATRDDVRVQWNIIGSVKGVAYNEGGEDEILVLRHH